MKSEVFSGARAILKLNGTIVGYCLAMTGSTAINYTPIDACGSLAVVEHVPVGYVVELTAQLSRLARFTRLNTGEFVTPEGVAQAAEATSPQIMPAFAGDGMSILTSGELTAVVQDVVNKISVYTVKGVKCTTKAWDVSGRAPVAENCNFVARLMVEDQENTAAIGS